MGMLDNIGDVKLTKGTRPQGAPVGVVTNSVEFARVAGLPRRVLDLDAVPDVTELFAKPDGTMKLWPIQSACLIEAAEANGLFGMLGCGAGKTLLTLLLPIAMASKKAVILTKSRLKKQLAHEVANVYGPHFVLPMDRITVVAFEELSDADHDDVLELADPDLIIVDEAHNLRNATGGSKESVRGGRFRRFVQTHAGCRYAYLSGTITNRTIKDYAHLVESALKKNSPVPRGFREINDWGGALDVKPEYVMKPGVLMQFCQDGEQVRDGYKRRLTETHGVVATSDTDVPGCSLIVRRLAPPVPPAVTQKLQQVRKTWAIDGDEFTEATQVVALLRRLACGFYYRWAHKPDPDWLAARSAWNCEVREMLKRSIPKMDSPYLLEQAAERHHNGKPTKAKTWASQTWAAWRELKELPEPPTETIWVSDFLVHESLQWAQKAMKEGPAIIWYSHLALGEKLAEVSGLPHFGAGTSAFASREPVIICSMRAQGTGSNLQHYSQNLFTTMPSSGSEFEQVAARTHRAGQEADEVVVDWFGFTEETKNALASVIEDATYVYETSSQRQRILRATKIG